ncbi:hypothetical protein OVX87_33230 [Klebsiella pneumoniae]|nr:hypothetical protein [Klebsiella pneumoniae]MCY0629713.1 hypothetical protein [Klebsiella pneumoniae]
MTHLKLTPAEEKRLADAFVAQALAMGLKGNKTLPKAVKQQVGKGASCHSGRT